MTIGICEDHPNLRNTMKACFHMMGYVVILEAGNGKLFIEKLNDNLIPDLCVVDIKMPEMNGYETTNLIKVYWPRTKVLIYSLSQSSRSKEKAFACGADGYLVKPFTIDELEAAIAQTTKCSIPDYS